MEYVGIDVHKNQSQICLLTEAGEVLHQRILIEASTASEWVAQCLEALGHEVVVAAPNYAPMYAPRSRRVKTDRHDAEAVAHACRLGAYHPAHRTSARQRRPGGTRTTTPTRAESPRHVWRYDVVHDETTDGRRKCLTVLDEYRREGLVMHCARSITAAEVVQVLPRLCA